MHVSVSHIPHLGVEFQNSCTPCYLNSCVPVLVFCSGTVIYYSNFAEMDEPEHILSMYLLCNLHKRNMLLLNACCLFLPYFCVLFPEINGNFSSLKFALEHFKNPTQNSVDSALHQAMKTINKYSWSQRNKKQEKR